MPEVTQSAPAPLPGVPAAELALILEAARAFTERFAGSPAPARPGGEVFGALAGSITPEPPGLRGAWIEHLGTAAPVKYWCMTT